MTNGRGRLTVVRMLDWSDFYYVSEWVVRLVMLVYVPQRRNTNAARAWLLLIFLLPWAGLAAYALIGRPFLPHRRVAMQRQVSEFIRYQQALRPAVMGATPELSGAMRHVVTLARRLGDFGIVGGNAIELIDDYEAAVERLVADVDAARHHVHLLYYIFADDRTGNRVADALVRARGRGVECRLLVDGRGSKGALRTLAPRLREAGVEVTALMPAHLLRRLTTARVDLRNHRKIAVIDGRVGHIGSQNVIDRDFKPPLVYEEVVVRATGPVVLQLQAVLLADRYLETGEGAPEGVLDGGGMSDEATGISDEATEARSDEGVEAAGSSPSSLRRFVASSLSSCQVLPSGPGYPHENNQQLIVSLIHAAEYRVVITSPYFIPDEAFLQALQTAVMRGVEVHLVVSKQIDQYAVGLAQRAYYEELLEAGVRIYAYRRAFLHAKHVSVDADVAVIGTSNMDIRSFALNAEVMLVAYDPAVVERLRQIQERYFAGSEEITLAAWRARPRWHRVLQNTARLADSLL